MKFWFTSDEHYGHKNIIGLCHRPYVNVADMDASLIRNHNKLVKPEDEVYHLGDFAWSNSNDYLSKLNGTHFLVQGNHDNFILKSQFDNSLFKWIVTGYMFRRIAGYSMWLSHYPHLVWPSDYDTKGIMKTWHAFGHVHNIKLNYHVHCSINVSVDANNYKPLSWEQIRHRLLPEAKLVNEIRERSCNYE